MESPSSPAPSHAFDLKNWFQRNKLYAVGSIWGSAMAIAFMNQNFQKSTTNSRTSVKVIHSRLYAQAITLTALIAASAVEYYDRSQRSSKAIDPYEYKHDGQKKKNK
jgi:hypothetical protein